MPGARVTVSGWGTLWSFDEDFSSLMSDLGPELEGKVKAPIKLREVDMDWIDNASCNAAFAGTKPPRPLPRPSSAPFRGERTRTPVRAILAVLWSCATRLRGFVQVGVVSWGRGCGSDTPGVYARVAPFAGWIADTIKSN